MMFVKKDLITVYKQTILGPVWFLIQPILTTITYIIIFARVANFGTDNVPPILFYLGSVTVWNYFSETLNITSKTFTDNANIFGKVYFPRIVVPASKVISGIFKFFIQLGLFLVVWAYYVFIAKVISPNIYMLTLPVVLAEMAILSMGLGLIVTSLTTKYRDLSFLITFAVQLLMYVTPVIYPISKFKKYQTILWLNPLSSLFETFKYGFFGKGTFSPFWLGYSVAFSIVVFILGLVLFNKIEKRFIDTV
jgi:lipopolysaccharide transport system permease protein